MNAEDIAKRIESLGQEQQTDVINYISFLENSASKEMYSDDDIMVLRKRHGIPQPGCGRGNQLEDRGAARAGVFALFSEIEPISLCLLDLESALRLFGETLEEGLQGPGEVDAAMAIAFTERSQRISAGIVSMYYILMGEFERLVRELDDVVRGAFERAKAEEEGQSG